MLELSSDLRLKSALTQRPRRLRQSPAMRRLVRETLLTPADFIYPLFVQHGRGVRQEIPSMPGQYRLSVDQLAAEAAQASELGLGGVILFGIPAGKDPVGEENFADDGIVQRAIRELKANRPDLLVITDVCLCEYTDHGHCGLLDEQGQVLNDETLAILQQVAVSHAEAGADIVAPSGMMDGMVGAIRQGLDAHDYSHIPIMSYAVKYASAFYGPFRDAADGAPQFGDRKTHQMDPANAREALREAALDVAEGADFLMVKPALAYLDVIYRVKMAQPELPMVAYNVSGEYAMIKAAAAKGWLDEQATVLEKLISIKRAGADLIISYHAKDASRWLA
ncbi:MAG: porphobilinogen synthase [Ardenticatenales bacterium]|nr:porphobilinogen synthase [Ardenticatenales bacterium]